jgi:glycosyltransferase involved in cell wall biosynthesis
MTQPLVTITIPTYNQEKYIGRAIESCLKQDYPNLEIIVSDDCSTDGTYSAAKAYEGNQVKVHRTPANMGRVKNYRHTLYNLAKGEWVVNLDGDDFYNDPTFIAEAVQLLQSNPGCVMYAGGASGLEEATGKITQSPIYLKQPVTILKGTDYVLNFYKYGQIGQHFSVLYNRPLALSTDFYSLDSLGADTDSICRLALKGNVLVHKKWVGVWTSHGNNASYTLDTTRVDKELRMLEHIGEAARAHLPEETVAKWLRESKQLKFKQALWATMPRLSFNEGFSQLLKHWTWHLQDCKELIKLFLRLFRK